MANPWERDWSKPVTQGAPWERDWNARAVRPEPVTEAPVDDGEAGILDRIKDTGIDVVRGVVGLGESAVGLGDLVTGNLIGRGLAKIGYDPQRTQDILSSGYSQERQQENAEVQAAEGFLNTVLANVQNPAAALGTIVESSPMLLGSAGAIRAAATSMLAKAGIKAGTDDAVRFFADPAVRSRLALIGSGTEGAMAAGSTQEHARQSGREYTESVLPAIAGGVGTAAIGQLASRIPGLGDIETAVGTTGMGARGNLAVGQRIARGMFQEGVLEELPQSAQEQIFSNLALGKPWDEGVAEAAGTGLVAGSGMGALVRALEGRRDEPDTTSRIAGPAQPPPPVQPSVAAQDELATVAARYQQPVQDEAARDQIIQTLLQEEPSSVQPSQDRAGATPAPVAPVAPAEPAPQAPAVLLRRNGKPFGTREAAQNSYLIRDNPGATVVPVEGGFGVLPQSSENGVLNVTQGRQQPVSESQSESVLNVTPPDNSTQTKVGETSQVDDSVQFPRGTSPVEVPQQAPSGQVVDATSKFEDRQRAELQRQAQEAYSKEEVASKIDNAPVDSDGYARFEASSNTLGIPRSNMPQIKAEHRGALTQYLKGQGLSHEMETVPASSLKPTQAEFSPSKVKQAREYEGGDRSILISSDNHIIDGHHQWAAKLGDDIQVIRINAPIREVLETVKGFPSAEQASGAQPATTGAGPAAQPGNAPQVASSADFERIVSQSKTLSEARKRTDMKFGKDRAAALDDQVQTFWSAKKSAARAKVSPNDSLTKAIAKLGGISMNWMQDLTGDSVAPKGHIGLFQKTGTSPDDMAAKLVEAGYIVGEDYNKVATTRPDDDMRRMLKDEISGRKKHYQIDSKRGMDEGLKAEQDHYENQAASQAASREAQYAAIAAEHGQEAADLARQYDEALDALDVRADDAIESQLAQEREDENDQLNQSADADTTEDRQSIREGERESRGNEAQAAGEPAEDFSLNTQSEESLRAKEARASDQSIEAKAQIDRERDLFGLDKPAGNVAGVGQATAAQQRGMFDAPTRGQKKAEQDAATKTDEQRYQDKIDHWNSRAEKFGNDKILEEARTAQAGRILGRDFGESVEDFYARTPDARATRDWVADGGLTTAPQAGAFDSNSFDKARADRIAASLKAGNTHLDKVPPYVETMRGKKIYYVHDPKVKGVIRTVDNRGNVYVNWSDAYSAEREMASEVKDGKKMVMQSSLGPTDLKDYVLADSAPAKDTLFSQDVDTITIDGVDRATKNSNGNPIASTEEGIRNFWKWFGNSKVVDAQGRPQVVYHGTDTKFTKINMRKGAQNLFWFTSNKSSIESGDVGASGKGVIMEMYAKVENPADWKQYGNLGISEFDGRGLDGAILPEGDQFDGFVLEPSQIKSVKNKGQFDPANKSILFHVSPEQAMETNVPVEMPSDPLFAEAVVNTPGAKITDDGLLIDLVRFQKPDQEAQQSVRTGVFYLPAGSPNTKHYKTGKTGYGGTEKFEGTTLIRRPLFVKGATGGKAPELAYDKINSKGAYQKMRRDVLDAVTYSRSRSQKIEGAREVLEQYGADPDLADEIVRVSTEGNTLPYAIQENIVAHAVRDAGYDAVLGYSKGRGEKGAFISEVFDVRELTYPSEVISADIHKKFLPPLGSNSWLTADTSVTGMTVAEVTAAIQKPLEALKQQLDLDVYVVKSPADINIDPKKRYRGAYHNGAVYLFADNIQSARGAQVVLAHELIGHKGVLESATPEEWGSIKATIDRLKMGNKAARDIWAETQRRYPDASAETQYKEFLAIAAEKRELKSAMPRLFDQIKATLRRIFKALGFNQVFSDSDLEIILSNSERYLRESGQAAQEADGTLASQSASAESTLNRLKQTGHADAIQSDGTVRLYRGKGATRSEMLYADREDAKKAAFYSDGEVEEVFVDPATVRPEGRGFLPEGAYFSQDEPQAIDDALDALIGNDLEDDQVFSRKLPAADADGLSYVANVGPGDGMHVSVRGDGVKEYGPHEFFFHNIKDEPIGLARLTKNPKQASISMIALKDEYRGAGLGKAFYEYLLDDLGLEVKSDKEITDATANVYRSLLADHEGYVDADGRVVIKPKSAKNETLFSQGEPSEFEEENRRIREEDQTIWNRVKRQAKRQLTPAGLLPAEVFQSKIARDSKLAVVEFDVQHLVGQLERAIKEAYGVNASKLSEADKNALSEALGGKIPESVRGKTLEAIIAMRQYIDLQSGQYKDILREQISGMDGQLDEAERKLLQAFLDAGNIDNSTGSPQEKGAATKRRNALLDDAKEQAKAIWGDGKKMQESMGRVAALAEKIGLMETITENEGKYVHRSYQAFDDPDWPKKVPDKVLDDAREYLMTRLMEQDGMDRDKAQRRARVLIEDILKEGTAYDNLEAFIKESKLGAKDLSVLKARKQIAPQIRALLGQYNDPRLNFAKSASKMGRLIWNQRFLDRVREEGMGVFLFNEEDRPPNSTKIAAEGSEVYAPLNGLYAPREIVQAFKDALGKEQMANWYKTIVQINGIVKFGKTVLSPTTAMRNWQSAAFFTLANGHYDWTQMGKSVDGLREYFTKAGRPEKLAYLRKLKDLGVVYDTPYAGEMMRLLDDSDMERMMSGSDAGLGARKALQFAQSFYQYGDDFWKIIGFENEKNNLMKYGGMDEKAAEVEAAERIRNTYPTYSMIGRGIQSLRRFPLAGTFVSFPAEIIRTSFNMLKYIQKDLKNPKMRPLAYKRIAGLSFASGFAYALQALSKSMFDIDDDDEEAIRLQAAPWQQSSNLIFTGRDDKGNIRYIDQSFLDPYGYWKRPINAMLRDQPWQEEAATAAGELLQPFFGQEILAGALFQVAANKKESGGEVYKETDSPDRQLADITDHLRKALQPGIISNLERTWKAIKGETSPSGQQYNLQDEALGWAGWRVTTLDPKTALYYRSFDFNDAKSDASRTLTQVLTDPNDVSEDDIAEAYELTLKMRAQAYTDMARMVSASRKSGMSDEQIRTTLRGANVSIADIRALLRGDVPEWQPTKQSETSAVRRAEAILGREKAMQIRQRYQTARRAAQD